MIKVTLPLSIPSVLAGAILALVSCTSPWPLDRTKHAATSRVAPTLALPSSTPTAMLPLAAATQTSHASPAPISPLLTLDVPKIVSAHITEAEALLGEPTGVFPFDPGEIQELPSGGEYRQYELEGFSIDVSCDPGGFVRILRVFGRWGTGYTLADWPRIVSRLGLKSLGPPDAASPSAEWWTSPNSYRVTIKLSTFNNEVVSVTIVHRPDQPIVPLPPSPTPREPPTPPP